MRFAPLVVLLVALPAIVNALACNDATAASVNPVFHSASAHKWAEAADETEFRRFRIAHIASSVPAFTDSYSGRGVVMAVSGNNEVVPAYAAIQRLRATGNTLPVEVYHSGAINTDAAKEFESVMGVRVREVTVNQEETTLVPLAILQSSFADVLVMSPRTYALANPAALFESAEYTRTGLLMWPSMYKTAPTNPIWSMMGTSCVDAHEQSSAAALVNKKQAWSALHMAAHLRGAFYQSMIDGDEAILNFGAIATSTPTSFAPASKAVGAHYNIAGTRQFCAHSMVLSSPSGEAMFLSTANIDLAVAGSNADFLSCLKGVEAQEHDDAVVADIVRLQRAAPEHTSRIALQACTVVVVDRTTYNGYVGMGGDNYQWATQVPTTLAGDQVSVQATVLGNFYKANCGRFFSACADSLSETTNLPTFFFNLSVPAGRSANVKVQTPTLTTTLGYQRGNETLLRVVDNGPFRDECGSGGYFGNTPLDTTVYHNIVTGGYAVVAVAWRGSRQTQVNLPILVRITYNGPSSGAFSQAIVSFPAIVLAIIAVFLARF